MIVELKSKAAYQHQTMARKRAYIIVEKSIRMQSLNCNNSNGANGIKEREKGKTENWFPICFPITRKRRKNIVEVPLIGE